MLLVSLLLAAASVLAPDAIRIPVLILGGLMVMVVAFSSVELTLYLLILSTLLSPQLRFGGAATMAEAIAKHMTTTQSRGFTLRLDDMILTLISLTWLFRMAIFKDLGAVRRTPINQPIVWYWVASAFATLVGFYAGRVGMYGLFFVIKYLEYFVLFYMIVNHVHDEESIRRYISVMLFTCFVACLVGIAQIPGGGRVSAPFEGPEGEPNTFGGYLVLMFSVVLGIFLNVKGAMRTRMAALGFIILVPLAFTQSRSSYLALIVSILLFMVFAKQKRTMMAVLVVGGLLGAVAMPRQVINRVMFTFDQAREYGQLRAAGITIDTSTTARLFSWSRVLYHDFPRHPLLGVGVTGGKFMDAQYPRVLSETGLIGLATFLWFLRRVWVLLRQSFDRLKDPVLKGTALGTLCGYGGLLFHAIGANSFIIVRIMEPFMILLGLMLAAMLVQQHEAESSGDSSAPASSLQTARTV